MVRKECHSRCEFASKKYHEIVRNFVKTNFRIKENKLQNTFKKLSGTETHMMHIDLDRCRKIYDHYRNEYSNSL